MQKRHKSYFQKIINVLFPQHCSLCGLKCGDDNLAFCTECKKTLPIIKHACKKCGNELASLEINSCCGNCLNTPSLPAIRTIIIPCKYQYPINHCVLELKFAHKLIYAKTLGLILANHLQKYYSARKNSDKPQIIIPIPLHRKRLRKRGYNQALEIAKIIAQQLNIPIDRYNYIRTKETKPQMELPKEARRKNIKNAFTAKRNIQYKYAAVIDDVITTGSTMQEFCETLIKSGVGQIDIWSCAKTHYKLENLIS